MPIVFSLRIAKIFDLLLKQRGLTRDTDVISALKKGLLQIYSVAHATSKNLYFKAVGTGWG